MAIAQAVRQRVLALVNLWAAWNGLSPDQGTQRPLSRPENPYLGKATSRSLLHPIDANDSAPLKPLLFSSPSCLENAPFHSGGVDATQREHVSRTVSLSQETRSGTTNLLRT